MSQLSQFLLLMNLFKNAETALQMKDNGEKTFIWEHRKRWLINSLFYEEEQQHTFQSAVGIVRN
jgi:hypothetical protein